VRQQHDMAGAGTCSPICGEVTHIDDPEQAIPVETLKNGLKIRWFSLEFVQSLTILN
jgi:hypothetical protein